MSYVLADTWFPVNAEHHWSLKVDTAPAVEPVSTAEAKTHLRVDHSDEDAYIDTLVKAARKVAEQHLNRALITQTLVLSMDEFPNEPVIRLPRAPLQSVTSIVYEDVDSASQTFAASKYQVDANATPGRIALAPDETWPSTESSRLNAVRMTYVAGYGNAATDVPQDVIHGIKLLLGHWYSVRENVNIGNISTQLPWTVEALWSSEWVPEVT